MLKVSLCSPICLHPSVGSCLVLELVSSLDRDSLFSKWGSSSQSAALKESKNQGDTCQWALCESGEWTVPNPFVSGAAILCVRSCGYLVLDVCVHGFYLAFFVFPSGCTGGGNADRIQKLRKEYHQARREGLPFYEDDEGRTQPADYDQRWVGSTMRCKVLLQRSDLSEDAGLFAFSRNPLSV